MEDKYLDIRPNKQLYLLGIKDLYNGMILSTLSISSHGFALGWGILMKLVFLLSISSHGFALGWGILMKLVFLTYNPTIIP